MSQLPDPDAPPVLQHQDGAVLTLTLNRPGSLNSLDGALHEGLMAGLSRAASDRTVRCLVLTGAGRGFCAGQDLSDPAIAPAASGTLRDVGDLIETRYKPLAMALRSLPVPTVAAVNGVAAGAGANLALQCDIVVAARSASFLQAFSKIALIPDCGGTWLLPRLVGRAQALGLAMLATKLPAEDAQRIGLIWQCVDDVALAPTVAELAARLAAGPTRALVQTRVALDAADRMSWSEALDLEARLQRELGTAPDAREGVQAFLQKRPARFADR